eukprot:6156507-Pleurochrysis_carterae.AAC.1
MQYGGPSRPRKGDRRRTRGGETARRDPTRLRANAQTQSLFPCHFPSLLFSIAAYPISLLCRVPAAFRSGFRTISQMTPFFLLFSHTGFFLSRRSPC